MIEKLIEIFNSLGVVYDRSHYVGKAETYIVYDIYSTKFSMYAENKSMEKIEYVMVSIYSKSNYQDLKEKFIDKVNEGEDFTIIDIENEDYEEDTGFYHCPIKIAYI